MSLKARLRSRIKKSRKRGALWVRLLDVARLAVNAEGRAVLWTRLRHPGEIHQTTPYTCEDRYPELFDLAARLAPAAQRVLSFGCSTGEELIALRRRFPGAELIGAEINPRSRRIAIRKLANDPRAEVLHPNLVQGPFDVVFAMAVLQREPAKIAEMGIMDLSAHYPFERFDSAVGELAEALRAGGLLCVSNAHYRIEDSSVASLFDPVAASPAMKPPLFGRDGRRIESPAARTLFRKRGA
jgi:SAM-dependent methyltransferase